MDAERSEMVLRVCRFMNLDVADRTHRAMARAAIEAMRTPTPGMLTDAGTIDGFDGEHRNADKAHIDWWKAMIDAALSRP